MQINTLHSCNQHYFDSVELHPNVLLGVVLFLHAKTAKTILAINIFLQPCSCHLSDIKVIINWLLIKLVNQSIWVRVLASGLIS